MCEPVRRSTQPKAQILMQSSGFDCVEFSPDGRFIVSGTHDGVIAIWKKHESRWTRRNGAALN